MLLTAPSYNRAPFQLGLVQVPRLVDTLSLLRRQAPSVPLHHFQHGFGSLLTVRTSMTSPAPGWYYYGDTKVSLACMPAMTNLLSQRGSAANSVCAVAHCTEAAAIT